VSIPTEALEKAVELLVHHRVVDDVLLEFAVLRRVRQLAVQQQIADLQEGRLLGQIVDGVAAVQQDARLAAEEGDLSLARSGRG